MSAFFNRQLLLLIVVFLFFSNAKIAAANTNFPEVYPKQQLNISPEFKTVVNNNVQVFLSLTPKKYEELTGKKLTLSGVLKLKAAQKTLKKQLKKDGDDISKGLYILLAFFGLAWIAMGIKDDWNGSEWIINLVLTLLCWLPGLIHALIKMKNYYP